MRSSKSRSRSKNNRNNRSAGNNLNRVFDSSGPEGKVRGTPQQIIEKYTQLARDASLSGDRVAAENFQQHAEHYMRLLAEAQREIDARREQQERENRERQSQRDQQRADRGEQNDEQPTVAPMPSGDDQPQPDVMPVADADPLAVVDVSEPDEAPEEAAAKPKPRRRTRSKPKSDEVGAEQPETADPAPAEVAPAAE